MKPEHSPGRSGPRGWATVITPLRERWDQLPAQRQRQVRSREFLVDAGILLVLAALCSFDVRGLTSWLLGLGALLALGVEQHRRRRARALAPVESINPNPGASGQDRQPNRAKEQS